jgi:alpha-tubulin suppressor-like RCC1 family protein
VHQARVSAPMFADATVSATAEVFQQISPGYRHSCALTPAGTAYCWGGNDYNQLGLGTAPTSARPNPLPVSGGLSFTSLQTAGAGNFSCGMVIDGSVYCWGSNVHGQRGDGTPPKGIGLEIRFPTQVSGGLPWQQITVGGDHACGIVLTGEAYCWGKNNGELGDGTTTDRNVPTPVIGGLLFKLIAAGQSHTCGITTTDQVYCWGRSISFQGGPQHPVLVPTQVATSVTFATLTGGWISTCGLSTAGAAYCWGSSASGQVGDGTFGGKPSPTAVVGGLTWATLEARGQTACGVTTGGVSYCWGENTDGEIGNGTLTNSSVPVPIAAPHATAFTTIHAGGEVGCGLIGVPGKPFCWGKNNYGEAGDGTSLTRTVPTAVRLP